MTPAEKATLKALRQARWCITDAATILGEGIGTVSARVRRSEELASLWERHATKQPHRRGRPPKHACLTADVVRDALMRGARIADAARLLGVSWTAVHVWIVRHPELRDVIGTAVEVSS